MSRTVIRSPSCFLSLRHDRRFRLPPAERAGSVGHIDVIPQLFSRAIIPPAVVAELSHENTPPVVRAWLASKPTWLEVRTPSRIDPTLVFDDPGEVEAISLALEIKADLLLADDKKARRAARERGIATTAAIGVLELAAARDLLTLPDALRKVRATDFLVSDDILNAALVRDTARRRR